jgi:hypothetical protein
LNEWWAQNRAKLRSCRLESSEWRAQNRAKWRSYNDCIEQMLRSLACLSQVLNHWNNHKVTLQQWTMVWLNCKHKENEQSLGSAIKLFKKSCKNSRRSMICFAQIELDSISCLWMSDSKAWVNGRLKVERIACSKSSETKVIRWHFEWMACSKSSEWHA